MGNNLPSSARSLAALGRSTKSRAPFNKDATPVPSSKSPGPSPNQPEVPSKSHLDPRQAHPNPYYAMTETEQDHEALAKAFTGGKAPIEGVKAPPPLGSEHIDMEKLDVEKFQTKNEEMEKFVLEQLTGSITSETAKGAVPSLEEQIAVLQLLGVDQRKIDALQLKLDEQNRKLAEEAAQKALLSGRDQESSHPAFNFKSTASLPSQPKLTIDSQKILHPYGGTLSGLMTHMEKQSANNTKRDDGLVQDAFPLWLRRQMPVFDPFPELISASQASRSKEAVTIQKINPNTLPKATTATNDSMDAVFRHDPLQHLPGSNASQNQPAQHVETVISRRAASAAGVQVNIPGLATTELMDTLIASGEQKSALPTDFPIQNPFHVELLRKAISTPKTVPVETNERKFKNAHRFTSNL